METKSKWRPCFRLPPLIALLHFLISRNSHLCVATDTISLGQSLYGNQTIVSKEGNFELGFFAPGNSNNYYIGIWYKTIPVQTFVWVANRGTPISNTSSAELKISEDGNLVLLNSSKIPVWSTNSTSSAANSTVAVLLDTGNLVLRTWSNTSSPVWQSFDHPTDTWLPGGWLGVDKITGEYHSIISWENLENPAPGPFAQSMDPDGSNQYVLLWRGSEIYWNSGLWNGQFFGRTEPHTFFNVTFTDNARRKFAMYTNSDSSVITRAVIDSAGQLRQWVWLNNSEQWQTTMFTQPLSKCDVFSLCGNFGVCDERSSELCRCADGFVPASMQEWELNDYNSGCVRKTSLQCGNRSSIAGEEDGFLEMANVRMPANPQNLILGSARDCKLACLNNCSCSAYSFGSNCSIWGGDLRNLQQLYDGDSGGGTLYLHLAASDLPSSRSSHKKAIAVTVGVAAGALAILFALSGLIWACRRREGSWMVKQAEGSLIQFTYADLQRVTRNFSEKLGSGGFGSVFKGTLPDSTDVAVKKLEGLSQGEKQFRAEVSTLGAIQHVNLVHLRGFCCEGRKRLLAYEYMSGGSLGSQLFRSSSTILDWSTRYQIILGIARGLAYLHEKCRERIIHCDVKPDNILLDADFNAKVADFGMAKLVGRDFSRVLTTIRGTVGYLAPEWISGLPITPKVDVYSFGMMLFELVSGKRNTRYFTQDGSRVYYPAWAAQWVIDGEDVLSLLDNRLDGMADLEEVTRVCRVACWCIQDSEDQRPAMGRVVQILEGVVEVNVPPLALPTVLQQLTDSEVPTLSHLSSGEGHYSLDKSQDHEQISSM